MTPQELDALRKKVAGCGHPKRQTQYGQHCTTDDGHGPLDCPGYDPQAWDTWVAGLVDAAERLSVKPCDLNGWGQDGPFHNGAECRSCILTTALSTPEEEA